jgi:hypothetical protein
MKTQIKSIITAAIILLAACKAGNENMHSIFGASATAQEAIVQPSVDEQGKLISRINKEFKFDDQNRIIKITNRANNVAFEFYYNADNRIASSAKFQNGEMIESYDYFYIDSAKSPAFVNIYKAFEGGKELSACVQMDYDVFGKKIKETIFSYYDFSVTTRDFIFANGESSGLFEVSVNGAYRETKSVYNPLEGMANGDAAIVQLLPGASV